MPKPWPLLEKKFYWDELYDAVFYKPGRRCSRAASARSSSGR